MNRKKKDTSNEEYLRAAAFLEERKICGLRSIRSVHHFIIHRIVRRLRKAGSKRSQSIKSNIDLQFFGQHLLRNHKHVYLQEKS